MEESPRRCHECFPEISQQTFFLRKRFIQSHMSLVDRFIAPSEFLARPLRRLGDPAGEDHGRGVRPHAARRGRADRGARARDRFGFFGQLTPFKGLQVLLEAMPSARRSGATGRSSARGARGRRRHDRQDEAEERKAEPHVRIHGANLDLQPGSSRTGSTSCWKQTRENVTFVGAYEHDELASLMADVDWVIVPSIWWENSPLVIQEAFHFGRPVICSDIGGMAEKVDDGVERPALPGRRPDEPRAHDQRARPTSPACGSSCATGIRPMYRWTST